jgi:hypothetical protein
VSTLRTFAATLLLGAACGLIVAQSAMASDPQPPAGWERTAIGARDIAMTVPSVRRELAHARGTQVVVSRFLDVHRWQVSVFRGSPRRGGEERARVLIDDRTGRVLEAWTGPQVAWTMARGYPGAFGRIASSLWLWIALSFLFALPFLSRPARAIHADILALLAFSLSYAAFNAGNISLSVPLVYPLLAYLLARMLWVAGRGPPARLTRPAVPDRVLAAGILFLLAFRVALTINGGNVIDVGYAGVIGADRLTHLSALYGAFPVDNPRGDTYGPVVYGAYVPWELIFPWNGSFGRLAAADAAAVTFDLVAATTCWLLGRRLGGRRLGLLLAYLWAAYPFTLLVSATASNDALVAAAVVAVLLLASRPLLRGGGLALAGLTKFAPFALVPLLATYQRGRRGAVITVAAAAGVTALLLSPFDPATFWDRTLGFQAARASPFSIWGLWHGLGGVQVAVRAMAAVLALLVAFVPRRRDLRTLCALAAAVLIAVQLGLDHWFYLYLAWFVPLVWGALLASGHAGEAQEP